VVLSVVPLLGLWTCCALAEEAELDAPMTAAALGALAAMRPWLVRNYETFHQFIPIRSGFGLELYIGNSADALHWVDRSLHPNHSDAETGGIYAARRTCVHGAQDAAGEAVHS